MFGRANDQTRQCTRSLYGCAYLSKTTDYTNVWNLISGNLIGASTGKVGKDEVDLSDYDRYLYIRREKGVSYIDFVDDIGKASSQIIEFGKIFWI